MDQVVEEQKKEKLEMVWLTVLFGTFLALQIGDVLTTTWIINHGGKEFNTLTVSLVHSWYYLPVKLIPVVLVLPAFLALVLTRKSKLQKPLVVGLSCIVGVMGIVVTWNLVQIILHMAKVN